MHYSARCSAAGWPRHASLRSWQPRLRGLLWTISPYFQGADLLLSTSVTGMRCCRRPRRRLDGQPLQVGMWSDLHGGSHRRRRQTGEGQAASAPTRRFARSYARLRRQLPLDNVTEGRSRTACWAERPAQRQRPTSTKQVNQLLRPLRPVQLSAKSRPDTASNTPSSRPGRPPSGEFRGTKLQDVAKAVHAKATISMQFSTDMPEPPAGDGCLNHAVGSRQPDNLPPRKCPASHKGAEGHLRSGMRTSKWEGGEKYTDVWSQDLGLVAFLLSQTSFTHSLCDQWREKLRKTEKIARAVRRGLRSVCPEGISGRCRLVS